jgi:uncharacterized caspase-like protein
LKNIIYILLFIPFINQSQVVCKWFDIEKTEFENKTKIALVIGNSTYESIKELKNPVNDALLMKETFLKLGFDTILYKENLNFSSMKTALIEYNELQSNYDMGFIYYAGHGLQDKDGNAFLIPVNWDSKKDFESNTISINRLSKLLSNNKKNKNILILDACRSIYNPENNFSKPDIVEPVNVKMGFSTSYGHVAYDHPELSNSLYTKTLSNYLLIPNLNIHYIFHSTWNFVYTQSNFKQRPVQYFGELMDYMKLNTNDCDQE